MAKVLLGSMAKYNLYGVQSGTLPEIDTTNGGIRLNANVSMAVGAKVEFDGLKFNELTNASLSRYLIDSLDANAPRALTYCATPTSVISDAGIGNTVTTPNSISVLAYSSYVINKTVSPANLGVFFMRGNGTDFGRCRSKGIRVKNSVGAVVWEWLTKPSDFKSTPPSGSIIGTLGWRYQGIDGHYETTATLLSWLNATTLTEPLEIILLEPMDTSGIPSSKDGWAITISYGYNRNTAFSFGFNWGF